MIRTLLSIGGLIGMMALVSAGTVAFFSDNETSADNSFTAGTIDLKLDNDSYYNGNRCTEVREGVWQWEGDAAYPIPGTDCSTSFPSSDLDNGLLFFNFNDLKPDDRGEDTISVHAGSNDAYVCMDMTLTSNDDNSSNEPELAAGDAQDIPDNTWDGELAQNLEMFWWADDGDNVYEKDEQPITDGVQTLMDLASTSGPFSVTLADSQNNVWDPNNPGPIPGNETKYIGKAWCLGTLTTDPFDQDGLSSTTPDTNGPQVRVGGGVHCDGTLLGNNLQTDGATLDIAFRAIQARHNGGFLCQEQTPRLANVTVIKKVINDNGGNNIVSDFQLSLNGPSHIDMTSGVTTTVPAGNYAVAELGSQGYEATYSGDCDQDGNLVVQAGGSYVCTITNDDIRPNITLIKDVDNTGGGTADAADFIMRVNGTYVPTGSSRSVDSNTDIAITEDPKANYQFVSITGAGCPTNLGETFQLNEGEALTCTVHNKYMLPS